MKKLGHFYKEKLQEEFKKELESKNDFFVMTYIGTKASDFGQLRTRLKRTGARALVLKNTLTKMVLKEKGLDEITGLINGPTAFILGIDDSISVSKALVDFNKDCQTINLCGGFLENRVVDYNELKRISEIPSNEVLQAMLCSCLNSSVRGFVGLLHNKIKQFLFLLNQIREKRG